MPLFSQDLIAAAMRAFGHDADFRGICAGLSAMYGNALAADKEQEFFDRCNKIASPAFQKQIKQIEQLTSDYLKNNPNATKTEEQTFRDSNAKTLLGEAVWIEMQAFFNGIMLHQNPIEQQEIFKGFTTQDDILKIANLTESIALEKKGGLAEIGTYFGTHTDKELASFFDDLRKVLQDYSAKGFEIAHLLDASEHKIAFKYAEKKGWCVVDPNSLTHEFIHRKNFITHLKTVFPSNDIPELDIGLISLTTKQNPQLEKLRDEFQKLSAKHQFSKELIIVAMRAFGHDADFGGVSGGISAMYGNALAADQEQEFFDRCNKIANPAFQKQIKQIEQLTSNYLKNNPNAIKTEEQAFRDSTAKTLLGEAVWIEMQAFFNGIMLYQNPKKHQGILRGFPAQDDILKIANLTESVALEKKGGLAEIGTYFGIHTDKELTSLFDDLRKISRDHSTKGFEIVHLLENFENKVAFKYVEKKGWCVVNPNDLTHKFIHRKDFITHLKKVFPSNDMPELDIIRSHLAIGLKSLTTKQNPQLEKLRDEFQKLSAKHLIINKTTVRRTDTESLVHLTTIYNRPDILQRLAQYDY